ncbi:MAG: hypothetical protein HZB16_11105 [Armatimonadetes bacterium]|nr:hypothetical protein [Armatimonadota bacterium]
MKRLGMGVATLLVVAPVALFVIVLWFNWGKAVTLPVADPRVLALELPGNNRLYATLPEMLGGVFGFGAIIGALAAIVTFASLGRTWRSTIEAQRRDNERLAAANRALEGALPVLREGFDTAIGAIDPVVPAATPIGSAELLDDDVAAGVDLQKLAIEDAQRRRADRRRGR